MIYQIIDGFNNRFNLELDNISVSIDYGLILYRSSKEVGRIRKWSSYREIGDNDMTVYSDGCRGK